MNRKPQGVISYAGLDVPTLLAGARLMFTNPDEHLPRRFASLMPLFPLELIQSMPFVGVAQPGQNVAPGGFSIDPAEYHCLLHEQMPRLYTGDNLVRNTDAEGVFHGRGVVTVDEAWTTCFPQYQPFAGERLTIYPMGGGAQAVAVPESLYPKAAGFLRQAETALGVTRRCHDYAHYVYQRIRAGQPFDADQYENDYLETFDLPPVTIAQSDLGRMMQDVSMLRSVREGGEPDGLYTENAKRAEHILQYVPGLYACDVFEDTPITRHTSRLLQPMWEEGFVSDLWIPYPDAAAYAADRQTLDMAALCEGYQLAPVYDAQTRGGRYPDKVRVVILREKELRLRIGETLNNPAYGSGMSPLGSINRMVYLPNSKELLRQGKLMQEEHHFRCENTAVPPARYRSMVAMAALQETKGQLVDALYRRESVLSEVRDTQPDHERLHTMMNQPVEALENRLSGREKAQLSGYDADVDYLRRMGMEREWKPGPKKQKTFRFAPDSLRQASIESGFAMRAAVLRHPWDALALPPQQEPMPPQEAAAPDAEAAETQWLDFTEELTHPILPDRPPLWLEAASACYLTTDVGGLYPTDDQISQGDAVLPEPEVPGAPAPKGGGQEAAKGKKAAKAQKSDPAPKGSKGKKAAKPSGRQFSEEEILARQVHLVLPEDEEMPAVDKPESLPAEEDRIEATGVTTGAGGDVPVAGEAAAAVEPEKLAAESDKGTAVADTTNSSGAALNATDGHTEQTQAVSESVASPAEAVPSDEESAGGDAAITGQPAADGQATASSNPQKAVPAKPRKQSKKARKGAEEAAAPAEDQPAGLASHLQQLTNGQLRFLDLF